MPLVLKRTNDLLNDLLCFSLHLIDSENKEIEFIRKEKKLASLTSSLKFSNEQKHKKTTKKTKEEYLGEILEELEKDLSSFKLTIEKKR